jgi:hypothetical protein
MKLDHTTIGSLSAGGVGHAINTAIKEALRDCENRPALNKARTVNIQIEFTPAGDSLQDGAVQLGAVSVCAKVKTTTPIRAGNTDLLSAQSGADAHGEPVVTAHFTQLPMFGAEN